jgi:hypothetical protein
MEEAEKSDKIILGCIGFMVANLFLNRVIPYDVVMVRIITGILWGIMPLALSFAIKNNELRPYGVAGGAIYAVFQVYWQLSYIVGELGFSF